MLRNLSLTDGTHLVWDIFVCVCIYIHIKSQRDKKTDTINVTQWTSWPVNKPRSKYRLGTYNVSRKKTTDVKNHFSVENENLSNLSFII